MILIFSFKLTSLAITVIYITILLIALANDILYLYTLASLATAVSIERIIPVPKGTFFMFNNCSYSDLYSFYLKTHLHVRF
jgi:hypothetical protein